LADGCNRIVLSHPRIGHDRNLVRFQTRISLSAGTPVGGYCVAPLSWEGELVLWQQPQVDTDWQLRFTPADSMLLDLEGQPAPLAGWVWDLVKTHVHSYLGGIRINLAPPVKELKAFLLPLFDAGHQNEARLFLESMRPDAVKIDNRALKVDILTQTPDPPASDPTPPDQSPSADVAPPSPDDLARVMVLWETWDAVLVHMVMALFGEPLTLDDQQILLDTLLAARYEFSDRLAAKTLTTQFVRSQFIQAWQQINPVFRRHLGDDPAKSVLGYLAFFTAADALAALDQVGPNLGIEISRDGFLRLARLISDQPLTQLENPGTLNPRLREILGLGPPVEAPPEEAEPRPATPPPVEAGQPQSRRQPLKRDYYWALWKVGGRAWAAEGSAANANVRSLHPWTAEKGAGETFVKRVVQVLERAARQNGQKKNFPRNRRKWFEAMVLATAWQESCFRQFQVQQGKIVYLLSYNNTSVGLMQINERVWSGIYDRHKLRWDIHYNAAAGSEILALYLQRYILKQDAGALGTSKKAQRHLAGWLYALYNGGPRQLKRYPQRRAAGELYQSDQLLLDKYDQVIGQRRWISQVDCLPPG
ncbi:MAG: hypothetical protein WBG37_11475, partial [Desulfobacterales bacterium]